ncbi:hypothetical protein B0H63DRAFT_160273 [Podospora didyma]|uniref:Uncharacterized protein n=1 Tax=Podospora didyma TaxID=330526 RepID=A0AAE0NU98_9PEZI|nr:hypothetical protein B0H63DRAFT_160273 [Podospora didyma]
MCRQRPDRSRLRRLSICLLVSFFLHFLLASLCSCFNSLLELLFVRLTPAYSVEGLERHESTCPNSWFSLFLSFSFTDLFFSSLSPYLFCISRICKPNPPSYRTNKLSKICHHLDPRHRNTPAQPPKCSRREPSTLLEISRRIDATATTPTADAAASPL